MTRSKGAAVFVSVPRGHLIPGMPWVAGHFGGRGRLGGLRRVRTDRNHKSSHFDDSIPGRGKINLLLSFDSEQMHKTRESA